MTAPMPETMSPREQYEQAKRDFNNIRDDGTVAPRDMSPREKVAAAVREASRSQWNDGVRVGSAKWCNHLTNAILAALASSGDHAELARDDGDCETCDGTGEVEAHVGVGTDYIPCPDCVSRSLNAEKSDLIAEVAALREQLDWMTRDRNAVIGERDRADTMMQSADARATEAERKLAEADGLLIELADAPQPKDTGGRFFRAMSSINAYVARLNASKLSKEAERG